MKDENKINSITVANVAVERFVDAVLLVLGAADEDDAAAVAFGALGDGRDTPALYRVCILHRQRNRVLCT